MDTSSFCRSLQPGYAEVGGIRTHFVACGDGPPVVLIHGLGASFWNWWRNLPELARHFRVIAFDLLGCGASAKPAVRYTAEACTRQLVGLLDLLGIQRAALIGHSMGSRIALNTALTHPERVHSMVLAGPSCYRQTAGRPVALLLLPGVGEVYSRLLFTGRTERLVRRALRFSMHPRALVTDEEIRWNNDIRRAREAAPGALLPALRAPHALSPPLAADRSAPGDRREGPSCRGR